MGTVGRKGVWVEEVGKGGVSGRDDAGWSPKVVGRTSRRCGVEEFKGRCLLRIRRASFQMRRRAVMAGGIS